MFETYRRRRYNNNNIHASCINKQINQTCIIAAIEALKKAILIDKKNANFRNAAKHHQEIAEIYESDIIDLKGAKENWEQASNLHMADDSPA